jgi:bacillithiol biosynthesis cysteine-adding enzyme BshC
VHGAGAAAQFFSGPWTEVSSYQEKARAVDLRFDRESRALAARAVRMQGPDGEARLERFVEESGYMVTTGQQPGLFTGPLYSIYKGLTAIELAARLEDQLGRPVIPVFWVASEDHDWAEANHTFALDHENRLTRVEVADPGGETRRPIHRIELGSDLAEALERFSAALPATDFSDDVLAVLQRAYTPGTTLDRGFRATIDELLGPLGIATTDAADPTVKSVSAPLLLDALERAPEHEATLSDTVTRLEAGGYDAQVTVLPDAVNLFLEGPGGRERIYREGTGFKLNTSGTHLSLDEIRDRCAREPGVLSPNVLLRPVVESAVFPTVSYVGGPGELAYFAQLGEYFALQGIRMPVIYPRVSVTVVERKVRKVLDKLDVDVETLDRPFHEVAADFARDEVPVEIKRALGQLRGAVGQGIGSLLESTRSIDPTLKGPVQAARNASFAAFNELEKKILQSVKRESEIALGQLSKARQNLFPDGRPQERTLNVFQYLVRYGRGVLAEMGERVRDLVRMNSEETASSEER